MNDLAARYLQQFAVFGNSLNFNPGADLHDTNLEDADLYHADLSGVKNFPTIPMACPSEGSFIGWKIADNHIIKLEIPENAKRSSSTDNKCRCNKAKVLAIENLDGTPADVTEVRSDYDKELHLQSWRNCYC